MGRRPSHHYYVYVVALSDSVWNEARFRRANPDYRFDQPCVYVGMTGLDPDLRFDRHKADIQANRFVRDYGLRLMRYGSRAGNWLARSRLCGLAGVMDKTEGERE
jgi:hypothetical protein